MTSEKIIKLLSQAERDTLDFKSELYDFTDINARLNFVKDIVCMANTPREEPAYIICGVEDFNGRPTKICGVNLEDLMDEADLVNQFTDRVHPNPKFNILPIVVEDKQLVVFEVPVVRTGPIMFIKDTGSDKGDKVNIGRRSQIFFRRGSSNAIAKNPAELNSIVSWCTGGSIVTNVPDRSIPQWTELLQSVEKFKPENKYVLISSSTLVGEGCKLEGVCNIDWHSVIDFDMLSEESGLLSVIREPYSRRKAVKLISSNDPSSLYNVSERACTWFFINGLSGRNQSISYKKHSEWLRNCGKNTRDYTELLAKDILPAQLICLILWSTEQNLNILRTLISDLISSFGDNVRFVINTGDEVLLSEIAEDYDINLYTIPLNQLNDGLIQSGSGIDELDCQVIRLPASEKECISISRETESWIKEDMELIHMDIGKLRPSNEVPGIGFLKGNEISWYDLGMHEDIERYKINITVDEVRNLLDQRKANRYHIYHEPGAGGTTYSKRIVWNLHERYPTAKLIRISQGTIERLLELITMTQLPVLLYIEDKLINENQVDELYNRIRALNISALLLCTKRRKSKSLKSEKSVFVESELKGTEIDHMIGRLSRVAPRAASTLNMARNSLSKGSCTAFYLCLCAFGRDFVGLREYVRARVEELSITQKELYALICIVYYYAQSTIPLRVLCQHYQIPESESSDYSEILNTNSFTRELVAVDDKLSVRPIHQCIAEEMLIQILADGHIDRQVWKYKLVDIGRILVSVLRGRNRVVSTKMLELANRMFVYRDRGMSSTRNNNPDDPYFHYSKYIEDIKSDPGKKEIFEELTSQFQNETHMLAHYGRYLTKTMREYEKGRGMIRQAIDITPDDAVLYHMYAMTYFDHIKHSFESLSEDDLLVLAESASESFTISREKDPYNEYGYVSEINLIVKVVRWYDSNYQGGYMTYIQNEKARPYVRYIRDKAHFLLDSAERNREGEKASIHIVNCKAAIKRMEENHDDALSIYKEMLRRPDTYKPQVRRDIVWTYLSQREGKWENMSESEITYLCDLLRLNISEEPSSERNLGPYMKAIRYAKYPPNIEQLIDNLTNWSFVSDHVDATYYLYICYMILALDAGGLAIDSCKKAIDDSRMRSMNRGNRSYTIDFLGTGTGIKKLVHISQMGERESKKDMWSNTRLLNRYRGRIKYIKSNQSGVIVLKNGIELFFLPYKVNPPEKRQTNQMVDFYIGFTYDGPRAWDVKPI